MKTVITLELEHSKEVADLLDKVAGRAYTIDGIEDVTAKLAQPDDGLEALRSMLEKAVNDLKQG